MKLTKKTVEALRFPEEAKGKTQVLVFDDFVKGLGIRVTPKGKKSFILEYKVSGKSRRMTLGTFPIMSPEHARELAVKNLAVKFSGQDPAEEKKKKKRKGRTLKDLYVFYFEKHVKVKRNERGRYLVQGDFDRYILPKLAGVRLTDISRNRLISTLEPLRDRPRTYNICRSYLKTMFSLGVREEWIEKSPVYDIDKLPERSREEWIREGDLKKLYAEVEKYPNAYLRGYFKLLAYTACRKSELQEMKWEQIDMDHKIWTIPETKNGTRHDVHLTESALRILLEVPKVKDCPYVFVGTDQNSFFKDTGKPWQRIRKRANLERYRIHDIRRTMASYLAQARVSRDRIAQILNHKDQSTTGIYAKLTHRDKVDTFEKLGEILEGIIQVGDECKE